MPNATPVTGLSEGQRLMLLQTLRKGYLFAGIPLATVQHLLAGCSLLRLSKGAYLFHDGQQASGFYVIHSGAVNVHRVSEGGKEQVIRIFYPGESFGEVVLAGNHAYPASAKAIEDSQVVLVPTPFFRAQIQHDPDLALGILASMSQHLRYLVTTIEDLKLKQAETRLAQWLLRQLEIEGKQHQSPATFTLPLAKHLLASQLGITSETLSRGLATLRRQQLVAIDGKSVTITDPVALRDFILSAAGE